MGSSTTSTNTRIRVLSREVKLTYLQSVQVTTGEQDAGLLAGVGGGVGPVNSNSSNPGSPGFLGIGGSAPSSQSGSSNDTGWIMNRTWKETSFDKVRYPIGIRDIGIFHYEFAPVSELVSISFRSPKEVLKVQVRAVEQIPSIFPLDRRYVAYYVSPDDGEHWHQINPLDHPILVDEDGLTVPRTITFNPEIGGAGDGLTKFVETAAPVFALRYRFVTRAATDVPDASRHTPIVKSIRMLMYPKGGL